MEATMERKATHTPGPWSVNDSGFGVYYVNPKIEAGDDSIDDPSHDSVVADTANMGAFSGIPDEQRMANARLIAAAPDLLEAAKAVREWEGFGTHSRTGIPAWDALIAAISKAEGVDSE